MKRSTAVSIVGLVLSAIAANAAAEPISFRYRVEISSFDISGLPQPARPLKPFSLVATFDSEPTQIYDVGVFFGPVSFSRIPLDAPSPYGDRPMHPSYNASDTYVFDLGADGFLQGAGLDDARLQKDDFSLGGRAYSISIGLQSVRRGLSEPPDLTPFTLAETAGTPQVIDGESPFDNFHYFVEKNDVLTGERIALASYQGRAYFLGEVDSPAPVPEPASIVLLTTGALAIARSAYRKRRARILS